MACSVGITSDPDRRMAECRMLYRNFHDWEIQGPFCDRQEAQQYEMVYEELYGCGESAEDDDPDDTATAWYAYYFAHDGRL